MQIKGPSLAALVGQLMEAQGASMDDVAEAAGVNRSTISRVLSGEIMCPTGSRLQAMADLFNVSVAEIQRAAERDGCDYSGGQRADAGPDEAKPSPASGESRQEFIERCMASDEAQRDFPDRDQRFAFCQAQWENRENRNRGAAMETKSVPFECKVDRGQRIVEGYASTWDRDQIDDIILQGAFAKTIRERGDRVKVLWQHSEALGRPMHMEEDSTGLFTRSKISDTQLGNDALTLMEDGVVDSMSIGFSIPQGKAEFESDGWTRRISEVKLYEYSPVTFACNEAAVITGLKALETAARKHGPKAFGHEASEIRALIQSIEALVDGTEPPKGTRDGNQPPPAGADPDEAAIKAALQSLGDEATNFATQVAIANMRNST